MKLGINIDHIATLREARKINEPSPLEAIFVLKNAGAAHITLHLREDRRHIHDNDLQAIIANSPLPINLECATSEEIIALACELKPQQVTLVPEKRQEVTTEGGLNLKSPKLQETIQKLQDSGIITSLFIDPNLPSIEQSLALGVRHIELHTGEWANLNLMASSNLKHTQHKITSLDFPYPILQDKICNTLKQIQECAILGEREGLEVCAGHGLNYQNVKPIAQIPQIRELNIGHSIIARAIFVGLFEAIREMQSIINESI
ncbi:pyridoxine 5'-phosphate synthase [Helicobacter enhydrae]|uniref:Pyridoxine 5'-phosphate synthase n=1 Tax=Helicobacter enhydrae TaxID=222136 RepID=A0A1B1U5A1_9HELI|nr:pyridoxine 5'-phosphate synthase [Helicobacter enhydrae]ANV97865.1 pyridoxine 5'-phosphate synthase [Helicobacter enhydrae]